MSRFPAWEIIGGQDLALHGTDEIPKSPGLYLWRRVASPPPGAIELPSLFIDWVEKELAAPFLVAQDKQLTPAICVDQLTLGGYELDSKKRDTLAVLCNERRHRTELLNLIDISTGVGPTLYVGHSENLKTRIGQHLRGGTDLKDRLAQLGLSFDMTVLRYVVVPDEILNLASSPLAALTALEAIVTTLSMATLVMRIG